MATLLEKFVASRARVVTAPSGIVYHVRPILHESFNPIYAVITRERAKAAPKEDGSAPTVEDLIASMPERIEYQRLVARGGTVRMEWDGESTVEIPPAEQWPMPDVAFIFNIVEELSSSAPAQADEARRVL